VDFFLKKKDTDVRITSETKIGNLCFICRYSVLVVLGLLFSMDLPSGLQFTAYCLW